MSHPSDTELAILKTLWERSPQSARALHDGPGQALGWTLSSTRTTLARMVAKGLLSETRADGKGGGVRAYAPAQTKPRVMAGLMRRFMSRVMEIDGPLPTSAFTGSSVLDADELAEIKAIMAEMNETTEGEPET